MPGIIGQGTTFNLPNYVGELFLVSPTETPFLSSIGGLTAGGEPADGVVFGWQVSDLRDADKHRQRLEGLDAPTAEHRVRDSVHNVVEIHHEAVDLSYTKAAAAGQFATTGSVHPGAVGLAGGPRFDELTSQISKGLAQVARDIELGFINGSFQNPADNSAPRKTRGILEATATNVDDHALLVGDGASTIATDGTITETAHGLTEGNAVIARNLTTGAIGNLEEEHLYYVRAGPTSNTFTLGTTPGASAITFPSAGVADFYTTDVLTEAIVVELLQSVWEEGGIHEAETATLITNSTLKRALTTIFITSTNRQEQSRNVGGVNLQTINTDFGTLNIMLNRYMPSGALQVVSLEQCRPRFLPIPDKGFLFVEPLGTKGSSDKAQIYGEVGLEYGNEKAHGKTLALRAA